MTEKAYANPSQPTIGGQTFMMRSLYSAVSGLKTHQTENEILW